MKAVIENPEHGPVVAHAKPHGVAVSATLSVSDQPGVELRLREDDPPLDKTDDLKTAQTAEQSPAGNRIKGAHPSANRRASEIAGYTIPELQHVNPASLLPSFENPKFQRWLQRRLENKKGTPQYKTGVVGKDGEILPIVVYSSKTVWNGKAATLIVFSGTSLQDRVARELTYINAKLEEGIRKRTEELTKATAQLAEKQGELLRHKKELERVNKELVQTNTALSVLVRNIDRKHDELEKNIAGIVSSRIMPVIEELKGSKISEKHMAALELMATYLNELTPGPAKGHDVIIHLSPMEMRVAVLIKDGFRSNQIGRLLHISLDTVKTHRRSIRRKLGLCNSSFNLASYLQSKIGKQTRSTEPVALGDMQMEVSSK